MNSVNPKNKKKISFSDIQEKLLEICIICLLLLICFITFCAIVNPFFLLNWYLNSISIICWKIIAIIFYLGLPILGVCMAIKKCQEIRVANQLWNTKEHKSVNTWAIDFRLQNGRKPTLIDFEDYFERPFPKKEELGEIDINLFIIGDSYLKLKINDYLKELGCSEQPIDYRCKGFLDYVRNYRMLYNEVYYQLDFYFPKLNVAFEIHDFATNSKNSDTEIYNEQKDTFKHGPTFHKEKIDSAKQLGIEIKEIWEDEIEKETYKEEIKKCLLI